MKTSLKLLFFVITLLLCNSCVASEADKNTNNNGGVIMEEIWKIEDINKFIIALDDHITEKCTYGENLSVLSEAERMFFVTQTVEKEVNGGGFSQFFCNANAVIVNEMQSAFSAIGAEKTAQICFQAVSAFGRDLPLNGEDYEQLLDLLDDESVDDALIACDDSFMAYEDDLNVLNYEYVLQHKEQFS